MITMAPAKPPTTPPMVAPSPPPPEEMFEVVAINADGGDGDDVDGGDEDDLRSTPRLPSFGSKFAEKGKSVLVFFSDEPSGKAVKTVVGWK